MKHAKSLFPTLLGLLLLLTAAACKEAQHVDAVPQVAKPLTQFTDTADTTKGYEYMQTNFTCQLNGIRASGQLRIHRDSVIWVSLTKLVELGRVRLTPDSCRAYIKLTNQHIACTYDQLRNDLQLDVDFATVQSVLTGGGSRKALLLVDYDDFDTIDGHELPLSLDITLNDRRFYNNVHLSYSRVVFDLPLSFPYAVPHDTPLLWPPAAQ